MSDEEYSAGTSADTTSFTKSPKKEFKRKNKRYDSIDEHEEKIKHPLLRRLPSFQSALRPKFGRFRSSFRKFNCFKNNNEEELPMFEIPRQKSLDFNMGLARRVSLFLFTKRAVNVHPYHPYTPEQTTRKIHFGFDDRHK